eukprot:SAG22_NODE_2576_length_2423_cov_1.894148_3_plen_121_part_01
MAQPSGVAADRRQQPPAPSSPGQPHAAPDGEFDAWGRPVPGWSASGRGGSGGKLGYALSCVLHTLRATNAMLFIFGLLLQILGSRHDNSMLEGGDPFARGMAALGLGAIALGLFGLYATWH